ncbi:myotubularin-related protein 7-like [Epinephelus moara]|uniref:myotubularin-related protein 7-like n=1 Tax=Epinephelus moara TaxID=300413 RepID=UPI00214F044E|nr:myotubularin-related protein 7-like [Epinephelus moara]
MEHIRTPKVENVRLLDRSSGQRKASIGTLYLSATHTIFVENNPETRKETWVLHSMVSSVERPPTIPAGSQLILRCKDFRVFQILIPQERDCLDVHTSLVRLSRPEKYSELYCLSFNPNVNKVEREESWNFIDLMADYKRMGVPNNLWVATAANSEYRVCDTYPSELFVPKSATPAIIVGSSRFRSRGRFPALSYFHQDTLAAVCRCSQPLSGFSGRCQEDEMMLQSVMKSNPGSDYIYVVDTRPKLNAMANRAAGKGYENEDHYTNIKLQFIGIENIHVMRSSQQKIIDVGEMRAPSMTDFLYGLENSGWLKHIKAILDAGLFIARAVADEGVSVLVHCSDGWDRTAQACSVASILLDPHYRTIKGLMMLIERDWVSFGHKFSHRYAHLDGDPKEVSPVIDQFLECVWQLSEQFPCAFEFNERFLIAIHTHIYSCQYGTFLGNCQKERRDMRLHERSHSVWPQLWKDRAEYANPLYKAELSQSQGILRPNTTPFCFKMWKGLYNHVEKSTPPRQSPADFLSAVREESQQLEEELTNHQERIAALTGKPITWEKVSVPRRRTSQLRQKHCGPDPPTTYTDPITSPAQDNGHALSSEPANRKTQTKDPDLTLPLRAHAQLKSHNPDDLSTCSDLESGVADLSSRSSSGGDDGKDPDSDEAVFTTA